MNYDDNILFETNSLCDFLKNNNYPNLIKEFDELSALIKTNLNNKYDLGLFKCRKILEAFYKILLLNHRITILTNKKATEDGTVYPLVETLKKNINAIFIFPHYSKNLEHAINHLIDSGRFLVSGYANNGSVHGKP